MHGVTILSWGYSKALHKNFSNNRLDWIKSAVMVSWLFQRDNQFDSIIFELNVLNEPGSVKAFRAYYAFTGGRSWVHKIIMCFLFLTFLTYSVLFLFKHVLIVTVTNCSYIYYISQAALNCLTVREILQKKFYLQLAGDDLQQSFIIVITNNVSCRRLRLFILEEAVKNYWIDFNLAHHFYALII